MHRLPGPRTTALSSLIRFVILLSALVLVWGAPVEVQSISTTHAQLERMTSVPDVVAVKSGNWTDPTTWDKGTVPGEWAKVAIPPALDVTVDDAIKTPYKWIRVEGRLHFAEGTNTLLVAETVFVMGSFAMVNPNPAFTTQLILRSQGGPFDHTFDPLELTRGFISMTPVNIQGAPRTRGGVPLVGFPGVGATQFELEQTPSNWTAGDSLLVAPTIWSQDEVVRIKTIVGRQVVFDPPLKFTRTNVPGGPTSPTDPRIRIHVGNLTSNVVIQSDPVAVQAALGGDVSQLSHVMLMGGSHVIKHAAILNTGRTTISPVSDPLLLADGGRDPSLMPLCGLTVENVRGRYGLHFHNPGPTSLPSIVEDSVIEGPRNARLKLGIVNHSANVFIHRNIVHQIDGSGIFTEEGDENGDIAENFLVYSLGNNRDSTPDLGSDACQSGNYPEVWNRRRTSFGQRGTGIWLQSGNTPVLNNIIAGQAHAGIDHKQEGLDKRKLNTFTILVRPDQVVGGDAWVRSKVSYDYDPSRPMLEVRLPPLTMRGNVMYAIGDDKRYGEKAAFTSASMGLQMKQWPLRPKVLFQNMLAWNVGKCITAQYSDWGLLDDVTCISGVHYPGSRPDTTENANQGVNTFAQGGKYWEYRLLKIIGFKVPFIPSPLSVFGDVTVDGKPYVPTVEACGDGVDNDADGTIDEGCLP